MASVYRAALNGPLNTTDYILFLKG